MRQVTQLAGIRSGRVEKNIQLNLGTGVTCYLGLPSQEYCQATDTFW